ncbi:GT2 family glycosyltransferase [Herbihabitans rhizosphaerae]|uniref:GT2 family glycosyltransferase n=1 Tax=Herbihabitans rhizosphaerae TaxID=1872711 RepID=A0A4Q7KFB9_9PSEU|nr:GT2 family glycosyltransferase [Herbihabitans rhizosphaerae]
MVDNASDDGSLELAANHPSRPKTVRMSRNIGYAGALAAALSQVDTPFMAWLNDDTAPAADWLGRLEDALDADPRAAAASARLESMDGVPQSTGVRLTPRGYGADVTADVTDLPEVFGFCGGAALVRTSVLTDVGGVPAEFFCYYEDTDTAWRMRLAGWTVISVPEARVRHAHGASTGIGSRQFHLWNERNRLLTLFRCAPLTVAARELIAFTATTALLPLRRLTEPAPNLRFPLRLRVLGEVLARLPSTLLARTRISARSSIPRTEIWRHWAART